MGYFVQLNIIIQIVSHKVQGKNKENKLYMLAVTGVMKLSSTGSTLRVSCTANMANKYKLYFLFRRLKYLIL